MPDFLVVRTMSASLVIEADSPDEALDIAASLSSSEFENGDYEDHIDPDYGDFVQFMKNNKEKF